MKRMSCALFSRLCLTLALAPAFLNAKAIVFWQEGFPSIETQPATRASLAAALRDTDPEFADIAALQRAATLDGADLLVLPYGSAFPQDSWSGILRYLRQGGNLLVLGGRPFRVPVARDGEQWRPLQPQEAYERELGILHTYPAPLIQTAQASFDWKSGYDNILPKLSVEARQSFVLEGRGLDGLGYLIDPEGQKIAAPVAAVQHTHPGDSGMLGSRWVFLDFEPAPAYWSTTDGTALVHAAAAYAINGATSLSLEPQFATLKPDESPLVTIHIRDSLRARGGMKQAGTVVVELLTENKLLAKSEARAGGKAVDSVVSFHEGLKPGFYTLRGTYLRDGKPREFYENGFWVEDPEALTSGPALALSGDFLTRGGKPFFPFGTNYFSTESNGWDFSGPRNAAVWEQDFAEMQTHGVSFVRTGVWNDQYKFLDANGGVPERFLRNLEAYILSARRHNIAVNFTFFAFDPQTTLRLHGELPVASLPGSNPYLDPVTIHAEQAYMLSVVGRFKNVPDLCWDLINEPSFSNPSHLWKGNTPNNDPAEITAWHSWLHQRYKEPSRLAEARSVTPDQIASFDSVPLPSQTDLAPDREAGHTGQVRAFDYNMFAQEMFANWTKTMVSAIRATGSLNS
jgi:hypothetical protein